MAYRKLYSILGFVLGLGAPAGALVLRAFVTQKSFWIAWVQSEWRSYDYFYAYMTIGSAVVFTLFGYLMGHRGDRLRHEREEVTETFDNLNLMAVTDSLTGLYNHRFLHERVALDIEAADRHGSTLTGLMIDLDNFKLINDRYGHPFGDLVLVSVARMIRENLRRIDMAGRYGGEEFMVLMPHTSVEEARPVAERIRHAVEVYPFLIKEEEIHVTLSIGMAVYPSPFQKINDKSTFIKTMDQALYHAKWLGKNKTFERSDLSKTGPSL